MSCVNYWNYCENCGKETYDCIRKEGNPCETENCKGFISSVTELDEEER